MPPKLKQYLNRTILVSIPALFQDGRCRAYTLQSIEDDGLWLSSNALAERLMPEHEQQTAETKQFVFVPATQLAAIILPPPSAAAEAKAVPAAGTQAVTAARPAVGKRGKTAAQGDGAPASDASATTAQ